MSKAREWPRGWQMPGPWAVPNLQMPPPGTDRAGRCPAVARGRGGWAHAELTDALIDMTIEEKYIELRKKSVNRKIIDRPPTFKSNQKPAYIALFKRRCKPQNVLNISRALPIWLPIRCPRKKMCMPHEKS